MRKNRKIKVVITWWDLVKCIIYNNNNNIKPNSLG